MMKVIFFFSSLMMYRRRCDANIHACRQTAKMYIGSGDGDGDDDDKAAAVTGESHMEEMNQYVHQIW